MIEDLSKYELMITLSLAILGILCLSIMVACIIVFKFCASLIFETLTSTGKQRLRSLSCFLTLYIVVSSNRVINERSKFEDRINELVDLNIV